MCLSDQSYLHDWLKSISWKISRNHDKMYKVFSFESTCEDKFGMDKNANETNQSVSYWADQAGSTYR